ncbi:MAG: Dam family site-specific DNA-(adenine-N6)-methyltransferase [Vicinamibacterales bacterium]
MTAPSRSVAPEAACYTSSRLMLPELRDARPEPAVAPEPDASLPPPPLKWAGGKRWQLDLLKPHWRRHAHRRLVEPFCGGLAVALGLAPERALLNDVNPHLINFYRSLQQGLEPPDRRHTKREYYAVRNQFNALIRTGRSESMEAAGLFYYLNRTGYNGLCRFNRKGGFNVPFGRHRTIKYERDLTDYVEPLSKWQFTCGPFEAVPLEPDDFVYADPPYDVEFTHYSGTHFSWDDQVRTAGWLAQHPGPVILSNQATPKILDLYRDLGYEVQTHPAPRRISCNGDRAPAQEVLAFRNLSDVAT